MLEGRVKDAGGAAQRGTGEPILSASMKTGARRALFARQNWGTAHP